MECPGTRFNLPKHLPEDMSIYEPHIVSIFEP